MSTKRVGLVAEKLGMSSIFAEDGAKVPVTLLKVDDLQVIGHKTVEKDGYNAVITASGKVKAKNLSKSVRTIYANQKLEPKRKIVEFRVDDVTKYSIGDKINVDNFEIGQYIDLTGITIGKGFAGGMKRHGFRGLEASHGVSVSHRSHGSTGQRQDPGKVFKGKKMAGHMGVDKVTVQNIEVLAADVEQNIIVVKGCVPGHKGSVLILKDAVKKAS